MGIFKKIKEECIENCEGDSSRFVLGCGKCRWNMHHSVCVSRAFANKLLGVTVNYPSHWDDEILELLEGKNERENKVNINEKKN